MGCRVAAGDSFKWMNNCDYKGFELVAISKSAKSLMSCAGACFANKDCNFFSYSSQTTICSLKNVNDVILNQRVRAAFAE